MRSGMDVVAERQGVARLFLIENEHELVLREAELGWVRELVREIEAGTLGGLKEWEGFHSQNAAAGARREEEDDG